MPPSPRHARAPTRALLCLLLLLGPGCLAHRVHYEPPAETASDAPPARPDRAAQRIPLIASAECRFEAQSTDGAFAPSPGLSRRYSSWLADECARVFGGLRELELQPAGAGAEGAALAVAPPGALRAELFVEVRMRHDPANRKWGTLTGATGFLLAPVTPVYRTEAELLAETLLTHEDAAGPTRTRRLVHRDRVQYRMGLSRITSDETARRDMRDAVARFAAHLLPRIERDAPALLTELAAARPAAEDATPRPRAIPALERHLAAVVTVRTRARQGSGFRVDPQGRILTNAHVVGDAASAALGLPDGGAVRARVLHRDPARDLALLQGPADPHHLPLRSEPAVGEAVWAIGSPLDYAFSVSRGVVSGVRRIRGVEHVQTDAAQSTGSSGGPLLAVSDGRVLGMTAVSRAGSRGIHFAISAGELERFLAEASGEPGEAP